ncbi:type II toxin-antitoxin system YoeB family toxin [Nostoc sp. UHCC 0702]|nr:type II toxin-antitoxin system YoeB family toxin [Nostoc sp. UHCC 0702]
MVIGAFKRIVRKNPRLEERIFEALEVLEVDPFSPPLKAHKLKGELEGLWACWVEYDCRIIYKFEPNPDVNEEMIIESQQLKHLTSIS